MLEKPKTAEYPAYYQNYVESVPEGNIMDQLSGQMEAALQIYKELSDQQALFFYAESKWTIKEVIGHITDTERIMAYRLLAIARGEKAELPGYDDEAYVRNSKFNEIALEDLITHYIAVRQSTIILARSIPSAAWNNCGFANGGPVSARALAYIIAGHELHHISILQDRYISKSDFPPH